MLEAGHDHTVDETIATMIGNHIATVEPSTTIAVLGQIFLDGDVAIVMEHGRVEAVLTKIDLIEHIAGRIDG
jgi:predicted transcriptional regulator